MPRDEDIAWKFVIRLEGKKWRCPYCQKGFSGNVTRVRSHLLKQLKGGISICKNVPEPISKLMDWLYNQDRNKDDIAWKFVDRLGNNKWCCHYCREEFCGDLTGVKGHLLKVPNEGIISICAEVPDPVRTLMLSLLDEGAEEESREANGQSSMEPQSHDMPTQAEVVADEESREANVQISTEPQTHDLPTQTEVADEGSREANSQIFTEVSPLLSPESLEYVRLFLPTPRGATHMANFTQQGVIGLNSDPPSQAERQFHQSSTTPSLVQNSHGETISCSTMALTEVESYLLNLPNQPQCSIRSLYPEETLMNDQQTPAGASSFQHDVGNSNCLQDCNQHSQLQTPMDIDPSIGSQHTSDSHIIEATIVELQVPEVATNATGPSSSQDIEKGFSNQEHAERHCISRMLEQERIPGNVRAAPTSTSHRRNVEGTTNLQFPRDVPPLTQSCELMEEMVQEVRAVNIANLPSGGAMSYYSASFLPNSSFPNGLFVSDSVIESPDFETSNAQQNPGAALPSPNGQLHDNITQNELQGSILPGPIASDTQLSNMATTNTPQHSSQPLQSDSQCGYGTGLSPLRASMDIEPPILSQPFDGPLIVEPLNSPRQIREDIINTMDPSTLEGMPKGAPAGASSFQYDRLLDVGNSNWFLDSNRPRISSVTSDSHIIEATIVELQVPEVATNAAGPSSSQDMNRASPIMNVRSTYANDEETRNLKRKVEELDDKAAVIKEQMEIESASSSVRKKPRILVERGLKETGRARNNCQIIGQANAETLPLKEPVETLMREVKKLIEQTFPQTLLIEERDAKGVKFLERKLTGEAIHRNIELICNHLKENHACKLGIYGMGGVGKTTIMMHIHNRLLKDKTFDGVVFITVSQDFSIYKLQSDIWKALKFDDMEDEYEERRATMLSERLERKKNCVLILDDVWKHFDLEEAGIPIKADGLKFVLTTRSFDVCHQMRCQEIKIEPLSQKEAESLFLEELGTKVPLNLETKAIVESIVKECAGLPIGVITMARSMRGVTDVFEWRDSLVKLEESSMGQTDMEKKVLMNLKFSYDRLDNPDIQKCFLSCALYPEDKFIDKFELIEFFIDQELIGGLSSTRKEQYDRGLTILKKLENVCLLEANESEMKMHDLIRDMSLHIMSATSFVKAGKSLRSIPPEEYWTDTLEKVSLMQNDIIEFPLNMSPNCPKLSTLLLNDSLKGDNVIPDSFFKNLWGLKILNLSGCSLTDLPNSISDLVNLRALLLIDCSALRRIPYLGKLTSLRKLDASGCNLLEAPEGLEMLINLRYLDLNLPLPEGALRDLVKLQYLKVRH